MTFNLNLSLQTMNYLYKNLPEFTLRNYQKENTRASKPTALKLILTIADYLQGPGFKSNLLPEECFACKNVCPLTNRTPTLTSVPCALIN